MNKSTLSVAMLIFCVALTGCNAYATAQRAHDIVGAVVAIAQADLPSLESTGVFSASEAQAVSGYLTLATNLNGQYETCVNNAQNTMLKTSGKFLACLSTFAGGLNDQKELAALRVMSPKAQEQMQLWITAASVGVSSVIAALGGQAPAAPQVAQVGSSNAEIRALAARVGYPLPDSNYETWLHDVVVVSSAP